MNNIRPIIPKPTDLKPVFKRFYRELIAMQVGSRSAELAYLTVISIVPILSVLMVTSRALGSGYTMMMRLQDWVLGFVTPSTSPELLGLMSSAILKMSDGVIGLSGLILTILVTARLLSRLDQLTQMIWGLGPSHKSVKRLAFMLLGLLGGLPVFLFFMGSALKLLPLVNDILPVVWISRAASFLTIFLIYYFLPNRNLKIQSAVISSLFVSLILYAGQAIYKWASHSIFYYDAVYGSLAFLPLFLVWVLIFWRIILGGMIFTRILNGWKQI